MTFINIKQVRFYLLTGAAWLILWIFIHFFNNPNTFILHSLNEIWLVIFIVAANFVFFEYGLPLIRKQRYTIFFSISIGIVVILLHLCIVSFGLYAWSNLGIQFHIYTTLRYANITGEGYSQITEAAFYHAQSGIASIFFFLIAKLFYDNFKLKQATQQLRLEKKEAELNYLKSQTNPHFLFNTLNNIYTLASDKSDLAPESILRLSKILRFMLYETNGEFIRIIQELEIIIDYIALEKLRYDDSLQVNFKYAIDDMQQPLPPLLLIPLVENAFKHGTSDTIDQPYVDIHLSLDQQQLLFIITNSADNLPGENNLSDRPPAVKENIGLANLRRQLQLLYSDYNLSVLQGKLEFTATLKINLASHV